MIFQTIFFFFDYHKYENNECKQQLSTFFAVDKQKKRQIIDETVGLNSRVRLKKFNTVVITQINFCRAARKHF